MRQRRVLKLGAQRPAQADEQGASVVGGARVPLTLYTRSGCHLCDDAAAVLAVLSEELGIAVETVDIDADETLRARFDHHVPVMCHDGREICRHTLDLPALEHYLAHVRP